MTQADICRLALGRLGEPTVPDTVLSEPPAGPATPAAAACRLFFSLATDEVLRSHAWNHAKRFLALPDTAAVVGPVDKWPWAHALPADSVRVLSVNDGADFEISGEQILVKGESKATRLEYVSRNIWPCRDALFCDALSLILAAKVSQRLRGSAGVDQNLMTEYQRITGPLSRMIDANESGRRPMRPPRFDLNAI